MSPEPHDDVSVFFNPRCSKCRGAAELLNERGIAFEKIEYLAAPPSRIALVSLVAKLVDRVAELVRRDDPAFRALGLDPAGYQEAQEVIELLLIHPELMQRPVVVSDGRAVIARPPERIAEVLG